HRRAAAAAELTLHRDGRARAGPPRRRNEHVDAEVLRLRHRRQPTFAAGGVRARAALAYRSRLKGFLRSRAPIPQRGILQASRLSQGGEGEDGGCRRVGSHVDITGAGGAWRAATRLRHIRYGMGTTWLTSV